MAGDYLLHHDTHDDFVSLLNVMYMELYGHLNPLAVPFVRQYPNLHYISGQVEKVLQR